MDANLDAKRLEELAAWATTEANAFDYEGSMKASGNLRDLARCAKAWAKYARLQGRLECDDSLTVYLFPKGGGLHDYTTAPTAIAAVEAAPEVTDAE